MCRTFEAIVESTVSCEGSALCCSVWWEKRWMNVSADDFRGPFIVIDDLHSCFADAGP